MGMPVVTSISGTGNIGKGVFYFAADPSFPT